MHPLSPAGNDIMRKSSLEGNYLASYKRDALKFRVIKLISFSGCTAAVTSLFGWGVEVSGPVASVPLKFSSTSALGLTDQLAGFYHSLRDEYCLRTSICMTLFPVHVPFLAHTPGYVGPGTCPHVLQGLLPTKHCQKEGAPGSEAFILQGWRRGATCMLRSICSLAE